MKGGAVMDYVALASLVVAVLSFVYTVWRDYRRK